MLTRSRAKRAPRLCTCPASSPPIAGRVTPPGTITPGRSRHPASASIVAGSPWSHVATPITPDAVGRERINRRMTTAASLRYGRLSNIPVVPCVRPSQGSLQYAAKGIAPAARSVSAASRTSSPISQCPVWYPNATGLPSSLRRPPWVLTMTYCGPSRAWGLQPMPTFCVRPNRLPLGSSRNLSGVRGSRPAGPSPASRPAATALAVPSTASSGGAGSLVCMITTLRRRAANCQQRRHHRQRRRCQGRGPVSVGAQHAAPLHRSWPGPLRCGGGPRRGRVHQLLGDGLDPEVEPFQGARSEQNEVAGLSEHHLVRCPLSGHVDGDPARPAF